MRFSRALLDYYELLDSIKTPCKTRVEGIIRSTDLNSPCVVVLAIDISIPRVAGARCVRIEHLLALAARQTAHMPLSLGHLQVEPVADDVSARRTPRDVTGTGLRRKFLLLVRARFLRTCCSVFRL